MNRRGFIAAVGSALASPLARSQPLAPKRTLGILSLDPAPPADMIPFIRSSIKLRELGWYEGTNLVVERRYAAGRIERLSEFAEELVAKRVDVIWTSGGEAAIAAARATKTIPIVFFGVLYPVEQGLVDSLPRPGRNVTGVAWATGTDVALKNLEFLREIAPHVRRTFRLAVPLSVRTVAGGDLSIQVREEIAAAYKRMGYESTRFDVKRPEDIEAAFGAILESRPQAVAVAANATTYRMIGKIVEFMNAHKLISWSFAREYVEGGGLFAYGSDIDTTVRDSFRYVDRILRGAKPADLPVELPSRYELAVNLKTAAHLGLKIPRTIIARADKLIE